MTDVIGSFVLWDRKKSQPSKGDFWACCPFHSEKRPSFHADNRLGRYHCFGCGVSGDVFSFLVEKTGITFPEAVERLAHQAGISMPASDAESEERERNRKKLLGIMEQATRYFQSCLSNASGHVARDYLAARGISQTSVKDFRLGYAPEERSGLKKHLLNLGISIDDMTAAGLIVTDSGSSFDRFRGRIMFPVCDFRGSVIAFGGRALARDVQAKYLNSPETILFHKGKILYHGPHMRACSQRAGNIIVVEGYMDAIALDHSGFKHVAASLGTAMTEEQILLLWRMVNEPLVCFDGDSAGKKAAIRTMSIALPLLTPGKSLRFVHLPDGMDPDDIIRAQGKEAMENLLGTAIPLVDMLWKSEVEAADLSTPERCAAFQIRMATLIKNIVNPSVRHFYASEFRDRVKTLLWETRSSTRFRKEAAGKGGKKSLPLQGAAIMNSPLAHGMKSPISMREAVLVMTALNHPHVLSEAIEELCSLEVTHQDLDSLRRILLDLAAEGKAESVEGLVDILNSRGFGSLILHLEAMIKGARIRFALRDSTPRDASRGFSHTVALHRKLQVLSRELERAKSLFEQEGTSENFERLVNIKKAIESTEGTEIMLEWISLSG